MACDQKAISDRCSLLLCWYLIYKLSVGLDINQIWSAVIIYMRAELVIDQDSGGFLGVDDRLGLQYFLP